MLQVDSDLVLTSGDRQLTLTSTAEQLRIAFNNWPALIFLMKQPQLRKYGSIKRTLRSTRHLNQTVSLQVNDKSVVSLKAGKVKSFSLLPVLKLLYYYWLA